MFHHLEGTVSEIGPNFVVLSCGGIGFALNATAYTVAGLKVGEKSKLFVYESIGETNFDLYGFAERQEKRSFELLLSVSGIGPKAALSILSTSTPAQLALAVMNDDVKALTVAPGVGKKIAQRVVLELKDKFKNENIAFDSSFVQEKVRPEENGALADAVTALTVLGYSHAEISSALKKFDAAGMTTEQIIKAVLRQMIK